MDIAILSSFANQVCFNVPLPIQTAEDSFFFTLVIGLSLSNERKVNKSYPLTEVFSSFPVVECIVGGVIKRLVCAAGEPDITAYLFSPLGKSNDLL